MASYTNLASLEGLNVGDVITYTSTTAIDFKGYTVSVELLGKANSTFGGRTAFTIDTSKLPQKILSFNKRGDLIYGNTTDLYYRIAVAGNSGYKGGYKTLSPITTGTGGTGGSDSAGKGGETRYSSAKAAGGTGGTQTSGKGFGSSEDSSIIGCGGYGWYSGNNGGTTTFSVGTFYGGGGGGSGFIIGVSTTTYPSGYLGDNTDLQNTIMSTISDGTLQGGASAKTSPEMILTIISVSSGGSSTVSTFKYYNGTEFVNVQAKYFNGTEFVPCNAYRYNGTEFVDLGG